MKNKDCDSLSTSSIASSSKSDKLGLPERQLTKFYLVCLLSRNMRVLHNVLWPKIQKTLLSLDTIVLRLVLFNPHETHSLDKPHFLWLIIHFPTAVRLSVHQTSRHQGRQADQACEGSFQILMRFSRINNFLKKPAKNKSKICYSCFLMSFLSLCSFCADIRITKGNAHKKKQHLKVKLRLVLFK